MDGGQSQGKRKRAEEESTEGTSTSSFISSEATTVDSDQYDVFLSFRGLDTRKSFTDCLYHNLLEAGIVPFGVFRDNNSIPIGEKFGPKILNAITRSKISILIISQNYASSKWCLRELIHIMDRKKSTSHIVLPIFYKVAPSDLRDPKGNFGEAFLLRQKHFDEKFIQKGQQALREVSYLHGWESEKVFNGFEGELIKDVVRTVQSELRKYFQLIVPRQLVGLDGQLKKIMDWIHNPSVNARMIGIYGMGGIGKTTLAKCVYNKVFDEFVQASFLLNIREKATQHQGIENLQSQLIYDILRIKNDVSKIDDGINIIKDRFEGKKVLIVLDDIDDKKQLDALAGERNWFMAGSIIIVATRNQAILDQSVFKVDHKYELEKMDEVHSLLLFNKHAFHMNHSPRDFEGISRDIISTIGGLPLALKVIGSHLYTKTNKKVWEEVWKQLKNQPDGEVGKILKISYDALEDGQKEIFLDIACFFIGKRSAFAIYMWEDYGLYPNDAIDKLISRCLIKVIEDEDDDYDDLCFFEMHDQLRDLGRSIFRQKLKESGKPWEYNYEGFPKALINLTGRPQFLDSLGAASSGHSQQLLSEVRWLQWKFIENDACLSTANLHLPKLSVLELEDSKITEDWQGWISFMASKRLQVLHVHGCHNLRHTPDLSAFTQLKILELRYCEELEHLHPSIDKLKSLVSLDLSNCTRLKELPKEVGELKDLEELLLYNSGIRKIPPSIASLRKLKKLSAKGCKSLREIPTSIGDLEKLQLLDLSESGIERLPSEIGDLPSLKKLDLSNTSISDLPEVRNLSSLQNLDLYSCYELRSLSELPSSLQHLDLTCCKVWQLPELPSSLQHLDLTCCKVWQLPELPSSLQHLNLSTCRELRSLPELPSSLQYLNLKDCNKLQSLPELPSGLTFLWVTSQSFGRLQLFSLIHLENLILEVTHLLEDIHKLTLITSKLYFEEWDKITTLRLHRLMHLEELSIKKCSSIKRLGLSGLIHLKQLRIEHCDSLVEIKGYDNLESLEVIFLYECKCLKNFEASSCGNLVEIQGLDDAKFLEYLNFAECKSIETLPDLTGFKKLGSLIVRDCKKLAQLRGHEMLNLTYLDISSCDSLEAIPNFLYECKCLKTFKASKCGNLVKIQGLDGAKFLEELDFTGCESMETLPDLTGCEKLQSLIVQDCKKLAQLQGLEMLNLTYLDISGCDSLGAIPNLFLYEYKCLKKFKASGCGNLVKIQGLDGAKFLEELDFTGCKSMETLPDLTGFEKLGSLIVRDCKKLAQLRGLEMLNLTYLDISGCDSLEAIPNLSGTRVNRNYERHSWF